MRVKKSLRWAVLAVFVLATAGDASLLGPWFRYQCNDLGFQIPVAQGWTMTPVPHGMVFAMQLDPYVRVAVGRLPAEPGTEDLKRFVTTHLNAMYPDDFILQSISIDGQSAIEVEG